MDATRFDAFARSLGAPTSRRAAGRLLARIGLAGLLAHAGASSAGSAGSKESRKGKSPKKKKPRLNRFGCVDVGNFCRNNGQCCSNICTGKKNRKSCQAHNDGFGACEGGGLGFCAAPDGGLVIGFVCTTSADEDGLCFTTTGNAPYCADGDVQETGCKVCRKDKDCEEFCGADAACIQCPKCDESFGVSTACASPTNSCVF